MGDLQDNPQGGKRTTSYYSLQDIKRRDILLRIPSTLSNEFELPYVQKVWFLPDHQILLYESWNDGSGNHDIVALLTAKNAKDWSVQRLLLPEFSGDPGVKGHGSLPLGVVNGSIIFDPLVYPRLKFFKKPLGQVPSTAEWFPFHIG